MLTDVGAALFLLGVLAPALSAQRGAASPPGGQLSPAEQKGLARLGDDAAQQYELIDSW